MHKRRQNLGGYSTPDGFRGRSILAVQLWYLVKVFLFHPSPRFANKWRLFLLRVFGAEVGQDVVIRPSVHVEYPWKVRIGNNSWLGEGVTLYSLGNITIGENSVVSQNAYLCTGSHDYHSINFDIYARDISIGNECWIASDVYIAPGVDVVSTSVIGARSSVFKSIGVAGLYLGSPVRLVEKF